MSDTPVPPAVPAAPAKAPVVPVQPITKPGPGIKPQLPTKTVRKPIQLQPSKVKITNHSARGVIADVQAALGKSDMPDSLKAAMQAELAGSGAKAATLDVHRHEIDGPNGKMITLHATIKPLF